LVFNFNLLTKLVEIKLQKEPLSKIDSHCNFKILFLLLELFSGIIVLKIKNESDNFLLIIELNVGNVYLIVVKFFEFLDFLGSPIFSFLN